MFVCPRRSIGSVVCRRRSGNRAEQFHLVASGVSIAAEVRMKKIFNALAISALVVGFASAAHAQVSVGVRIGPPPAPRAYKVPPQPRGDREWVEGYWTPQGSHYRWHDGTWARPPRPGAYWVQPYYADGRYYSGRWEGSNSHTNQRPETDHRQQRNDGQSDRR